MDLSRRRLLIGGVVLIAAPVIVRAASLMVIRGEPLIITPPPELIYPSTDRYILHGTTPVACADLMAWGHWLESNKRHVDLTTLPDGSYVSTVFLGLDHSWERHLGRPYRPVLFETMVFGGPNNETMDRYCTWDEALAGHRALVARERRRIIALENKS